MTRPSQMRVPPSTDNPYASSAKMTLKELEKVPTPPPTKTWSPTPHVDIPRAISALVKELDWEFTDGGKSRFDINVTANGAKMFGTTGVSIPGTDTSDEFGMMIGFRNSHNKTMALRFAVGTHVFVCSNGMMTGEFAVRREHTRFISVEETTRTAFGIIADRAGQVSEQFQAMQAVAVTEHEGVSFLAQSAEDGSLPLSAFLDARGHYLRARELSADVLDDIPESGDIRILHGETLWGAYQAVTDTWRDRSSFRLPHYSELLNRQVRDHYDIDIGTKQAA